METSGSNTYSHHTGSRLAHGKSDRAGDKHDRSMTLAEICKAERECEEMRKLLEEGAVSVDSSSNTSGDDE